MTDVEVRPLTAERWPDLVELFGPSGAFSNCWCTWWRQTGAEFERGIRDQGAGNKALHELDGREPAARPGAYRDDRPVGWISVAPRPDYGRVIRSPSIGPGRRSPEAADEGVWSIVCFWMPRAERGKGIAMALLRAAVDHARARGARVLEGYPIDTRGERQPQSNVFTGTLAMFTRVGFTEVERRAEGRPIVRLKLTVGQPRSPRDLVVVDQRVHLEQVVGVIGVVLASSGCHRRSRRWRPSSPTGSARELGHAIASRRRQSTPAVALGRPILGEPRALEEGEVLVGLIRRGPATPDAGDHHSTSSSMRWTKP